MADIKTDAPRIGIRGNPESLPVYQSHEKLAVQGSVPNFGNALNALATTPTFLGEVGSRLMTQSSIAIGTRYGQSLGKEPKGNLLPPITNFDKAVTDAYTNQAQVTLGNQANAMMYKAQEEMAKANKLTPDLIKTYQENMASGLQETLDMAPDSIRPQMENQFTHQLQSTTHEFNLKMTSQNKAEAESRAQVWRVHQNDLVTNMVKDAKTPEDFDKAKQQYEALRNNISTSNLSPAQKDTALTTGKLNYESALSIQKIMDARSRGKEDEYLSSIADKKIPGLSWSESEQVRDNTVRYLGAVETAENRDQNLIMSDAGREMAEQTFNESKLASLRDTLRPENYNKVATQWAKSQYKSNSENLVLQNVIKDPTDASKYAGLTPKQINSVFDNLSSSAIQKSQADGNPISMDEAEFRAASSMNTVIPKYVDRINREMANGNPQQVLSGLEAYERLHELDGNKVLGINEKGLAVASIYKDLLAAIPPDIDEALLKAKETVFNKDEEIIKQNNAKIHAYMTRYASTPQSRTSNAIALSGLSSGKNIDNPAAFEADMYSRFNGYMQLTDSNEAISKERTQKDAMKIWGESKVNGFTQTVRLGIEQAVGLPTNAAPLIQEDIINQIGPKLEANKKLFEMGGAPTYWRIKEGRTDYNTYAKAKLENYDKGLSDPKYAVHQQLIKKYESAPPIEMEQVGRNGVVKTWHLNTQSSAYAQRNPDGKVSGFNIGLRNPETGETGQIFGYYGDTHSVPSYQPNVNWITKNYLGVNHIPTGAELAKAYLGRASPYNEDTDNGWHP